MKKIVFILFLIGASVVITWFAVSQREALHFTQLLEHRSAEWQMEKVRLEAELSATQSRKPGRTVVKEAVEVEKQIDTKAIIEALQTLRAGSADPKSARRILHHMETLIDSGKAALPAIREFLARNEDIDYESSLQPTLRAAKDGKMQIDFVFPPSLRFGLLDVARQIGGSDAEKLLSDTLSATGRGAEVAYLARVLDQMAPGKYRETAVSIARELLSNPPATGPGPGLDKYDQNLLFGVLSLFNDASFAQQAQARLVGPDGAVDVGALKYLQTALAEQAVAVAANAYTDPRIDPAKKEPLARVALYYAGLDAKANAMFHQTISDPGLPLNARRELVEDLNQDGISSEKNPTPQDQRVIAARLQLIETYNGTVTEPRIIAAFAEAKKDLLQMQAKALGSALK